MTIRVAGVAFLACAAWANGFESAWAQQAPAGGNRPVPAPIRPAPRQAQPAPPAQQGAAGAAAPAQAQQPDPDPDGRRMQQLLHDWEQRSSRLDTLDVHITKIEENKAWGKEKFEGRAILMSPNLAWLDFQKVHAKKVGDQVKEELRPDERIICTGDEVWHYRIASKQIFVYDLGRDQRQRALEEGPLPFLFNMKAAEAQKRYKMKLFQEMPQAFVIIVTPLLEVDRESFSLAVVQLSRVGPNREYLLPTHIKLFDPERKGTKDYIIPADKMKPNAQVALNNFKGFVPKDGGWKVVHEKNAQIPQMGAAPAGPAAQPAQPAARGRFGRRSR